MTAEHTGQRMSNSGNDKNPISHLPNDNKSMSNT